jgi:hypothetical protein
VGICFGAVGFRLVVFWRVVLVRDVVDFPCRVVGLRLPVAGFLRDAGVRFLFEGFRVAMCFVYSILLNAIVQECERIIARMI